jgi:hypothetical protein
MTTLMIFLSILCVIFLYISLVLAQVKPPIWKRSMFIGMAGSGGTAIGLIAPEINPFAYLTFISSVAAMLGGVMYSYYDAPPLASLKPEQIEEVYEQKRDAVRDLVIGLAFALCLSAVIAYKGQQEKDTDATEDLNGSVVGLRNEVHALRSEVQKSGAVRDQRLTALENTTKPAAIERNAILLNQHKVMTDLNEVLRLLGQPAKGKAKSKTKPNPTVPVQKIAPKPVNTEPKEKERIEERKKWYQRLNPFGYRREDNDDELVKYILYEDQL